MELLLLILIYVSESNGYSGRKIIDKEGNLSTSSDTFFFIYVRINFYKLSETINSSQD